MASSSSVNIPLGCRVRVAAGSGTVRFLGQTAFSAGKWVGIELDEQDTGKNDGTVQGKAYFDLEKRGTLSGVFVRPSQVHVLELELQDYADVDELQDAGGAGTEVFAVPAPPKTRPMSSSSQAAIPTTPSATTARRPLTGRPSAASSSSPAPSPRPSLSRLTSSTTTTPSGTSTPARPKPGGTPRASSSTSSVSSSLPPSRRESAANTRPPSVTPRKPAVSSIDAAVRHPPPSIPRPSSSASNASIASALPRARPVTPRSELPLPASSSGMQRGISSSSSSSAVSAAAAEKTARLQALQQRMRSTTSDRPETQTAPSMPEHDETAEEGLPTSPSHLSLQRRQSRQADEDARFSLQPAAAIGQPTSTLLEKPSIFQRAYDELQLKLRLLETGRSEDRERLKELERLKEDYDSYSIARPKLQAKLIELSAEVKELRRQVKEAESEREELGRKVEEAEEKMEMEALDKEMAEEKLEQETLKLEQAEERVAELEVEMDVLRKDEARIVTQARGDIPEGEGEDNVKDSLAFIQLAKHNERLKEALIRLRDLSNENEQDNKRRIADLEKELDLTSDLQASFDTTVEQLEAAENLVENLKLRLDDAMGAEDMLEHLTERNLTLSERIEEMHAVIQDLEALKELNDELEENHVENEKQMQEEIDLKEYRMQEQRRQINTLEDGILDYEGTISQFRELVLSLQGDIEQLREQHATQQTETQSLSSQSQAMLNLNLKLQSTVLRNQSKVVDFELRKHEALQARQQLSIITPYLPTAFFEDDKAAIEALLFFDRLACKTEILLKAIEQTHGLADGAFGDTIPETLVKVCEARTKLARFSILCKRFNVNLQRCDAATFIRMGKVYLELSGIEKRLDAYIDLAKKEELKEAECGIEIERFTAQAAHVAESYLGESGLDFGEQQLGLVMGIDLELDTLIAGVGYTKQALALLSQDKDVTMELGDHDLDEAVFGRLQSLVEAARSNKVTSKKLLRRIEDVTGSAGSLRPEVIDPVESVGPNVRSIAVFASKLGDLVLHYVQEIRTSKEPFQVVPFFGIVQEAALDIKSQHKDMLGVEVVLRNLQQALSPALVAALDQENMVKPSFEAPWLGRVAELQAAQVKDLEAEHKVTKLTEDVKDLSRELRNKDQTIQESAVKIEHMERRMESVKKQADSIIELEAEISRATAAEKESEAAIEQLQSDLDALERENAKLKQAAPAEKSAGSSLDAGEYTAFTGSLETSHLVSQVESLRGTVRYLRSQNTFLRSQELLKDLSSLPTYETATSSSATTSENARIIREESNALMKQVAEMSSRAKVVDLSKVDKAWMPVGRQPAGQLAAKRAQLQALKKKIDSLADRKLQL